MITIYTDASCIIPLGISGWAAVIFYPSGRIVELFDSVKCGKINRMELFAAVTALSTLAPQAQAIVYTDSQYVARGSKQFKRPDDNADLWERLDALKETRTVQFKWIKSHGKDYGNWLADRLAKKAARRLRRASGCQ